MFIYLWALAFSTMWIIVIVRSVRNHQKLKKMRGEDYDWYRATHPESCSSGRIRCFKCNSDRLQVRNLMNRTFLRDHFCGQCGSTLYYSRERT